MLFPMPTLAERYYNNEGKKRILAFFFLFAANILLAASERIWFVNFFGAWTWQLNLKKIKS